jgi:hypothetical protein
MPTILRIRGYRFFFFSLEGKEPPHIHVEYGDGIAKFWLQPVALVSSYKLKSQELQKAKQLTEEHRQLFLEKWHEYFSRQNNTHRS